jgi:hypothetical protein
MGHEDWQHEVPLEQFCLSLSGILCARHSMIRWSMYAKQEDDEGGRGRGGEVADHPQGAH